MNFLRSKSPYKQFYEQGRELGTGNFAKVYEIKLKTKRESMVVGESYAAKHIIMKDLTEEEKDGIKTEIAIMQAIKHPNVLELFDLFEDKDKTILVLDLCRGGELFDRILEKEKYTERDAAVLCVTLLDALEYLHKKGIVHRDLKPENLLYLTKADESPIKIADFGLAKQSSDANMNTACGTPGYVAPEVLEAGQGDKGLTYGKQVDMWSLGVILYILLCGYPPFYHDHNAELFKLIKDANYEFASPYWDDISEGAKNCVRGLLKKDPKERYCAFPEDDQEKKSYALTADPWLAQYTEAPETDLDRQRLKKHQVMAKMRKAKAAIVATNRIKNMMAPLAVD